MYKFKFQIRNKPEYLTTKFIVKYLKDREFNQTCSINLITISSEVTLKATFKMKIMSEKTTQHLSVCHRRNNNETTFNNSLSESNLNRSS